MSLSVSGLFVAAGSAAHEIANKKMWAENAAMDEWDAAMDEWDACKCANRKTCSHAVVTKAASRRWNEAAEEHAAARKAYNDWLKISA